MGLGDFIALFASFPLFPPFSCPFFSHFSSLSFSPSLLLLSRYDFDVTLPEAKEDWSDEKKLQTIEKVYKELSNQKHPVSAAMFKMDTIEEIRIIEGKQ